jgi:two-component system response regulator YesN
MKAPLSMMSVIVADDHEPTRVIVRNILNSAGVTDVRSCADGQEALDLFAQRRADLVIADHMMPGMSGVDLISALQSGAAGARALLLTGYADIEKQALAAGANAVLVKPIEASALLLSVEAALCEGEV